MGISQHSNRLIYRIMKRVDTVTTEQILERNGCLLHYWLTGSEDKPLIIFTHGAGLYLDFLHDYVPVTVT